MMITASQCRAGRALAEVSRETLTEHSGVSEETIASFERGLSELDAAIIETLQHALEVMGVVFIAENGGGIGVRLKFTRSEARRILSLENEGGQVGEDEVP
jgi:transcriptional regulator with XRE-family HTH domain